MARGKTRVTLIHNERAGEADHSPAVLADLLRRAGCAVRYFAYRRCEIAAALEAAADLVAVAGGDGTVARVAARARPDGPPLAILPLGTANNLAKSLGLDRPLAELVAAWPARKLRPFYRIAAAGPWGQRPIVEGIGFGVLEQALLAMSGRPDKADARSGYAAAAMAAAPEHLELQIDGEVIGGPFAALEVTAIPLVGANLPLAPTADPGDRKFEICFVRDSRDRRRALANWLAAPDAAAPVSLRVAEQASIVGQYERVRLNGRVKTTTPERRWDYAQPIRLCIEAEPLPILACG